MDIYKTQIQMLKTSMAVKTMEVESMKVEPPILIKKTAILITTSNKMVVIIVPSLKHNIKMTQGISLSCH